MATEDQVQGPGENHGRGGHREPQRIPHAEMTRYGRGGEGKHAVQWGSMSPMLLWYSQNRAVSMSPEQNSFTLAISSERVIPWAICSESPCTNGLISGKRRSISWSTPRLAQETRITSRSSADSPNNRDRAGPGSGPWT